MRTGDKTVGVKTWVSCERVMRQVIIAGETKLMIRPDLFREVIGITTRGTQEKRVKNGWVAQVH